jgi:hypothetical protein
MTGTPLNGRSGERPRDLQLSPDPGTGAPRDFQHILSPGGRFSETKGAPGRGGPGALAAALFSPGGESGAVPDGHRSGDLAFGQEGI